MSPIYMFFEGHPPSINAAYFTKGHLRILSKEGKAYKVGVKNAIAMRYAATLPRLTTEEVLTVVYVFEYANADSLLCKGYPKKAEKKYKKVDASNMVKLLEDSLVEAMGYDDSQHWTVVAAKTVGNHDCTHVYITEETAGSPSAIQRAIGETVGMARQY